MNIKTIFFYICLFFTASLSSQEATLVFLSDEDGEVTVYRPIDGFYNSYHCNDTLSLKAGTEYVYKTHVDDWGVIKCVFPKGSITVYVQPGDPLHIIKKEKEFLFEGNNAAGNRLNNHSLLFYTVLSIHPEIDSVFNKYTTKESIDIQSVREKADTEILPKIYAFIDSAYSQENSKDAAYDFLKTEAAYRVNNRIMGKYMDLLKLPEFASQDSLVSKIRNAIVENYAPPSRKDLYKYPIGDLYDSSYSGYLYDRLSEEEKLKLISSREAHDLEPYNRYLLVSRDNLLSVLFSAFILQYQFSINEFDRIKMFEFLSKNYPESESLRIIKEYVNEELNDTTEVIAVFLERESVNSLSDIAKTAELKNKYVFIDLWATWCMPCRQQFLHNKQLHELLSQYDNIETLYISIDENKEKWERDIPALKLSGYHLLSSLELFNNLKKEVYDSDRVSVPRYILMDPEGNILDKDLPRPSDRKELRETLDRLLK